MTQSTRSNDFRDNSVTLSSLRIPSEILTKLQMRMKFLMSLNRFNVIASRARAKLIVLVSQDILSHLAHDIDVLRESRLLKLYADSFCNHNRTMDLGYMSSVHPLSFEEHSVGTTSTDARGHWCSYWLRTATGL